MPPLAELQRRMAMALLRGDGWDAEAPPARRADAAFDVHRDTVLSVLSNALRLTFPTVDTLVGERFFNQAAHAYAAARPPRRARLSEYGETFPAFLGGYAPAQALTYLADVARLDMAVAGALFAPGSSVRRHVAIEDRIDLALPLSLTTLALRHPADLIRAAIEADDDQALAAIDLAPRQRRIAVWRDGRTAVVQPLSLAPGQFLSAILDGDPAELALADVLAEAAAPQAALTAIQTEVFAARFAQITHTPCPDHTP
ncbi:MAG TPA: putative DNA-binding domain-containing protein [Caulobacteraceae bacterium]|jgi:hypothetical protein|nr:putative DNA-binding domain-containing protein [Caulobacteraceae bacterium]